MYNECHLLTNTEYLQGQIVQITMLVKRLYKLIWYCLDNYLNLVQLYPFFSYFWCCHYVACLCRTPQTMAHVTVAIHSELLWETIQSPCETQSNNGNHHPETLALVKWACSLECAGQKTCTEMNKKKKKKKVSEVCWSTAVCTASGHQQHSNILVNQQFYSGNRVCSLGRKKKKVNRTQTEK